MHHKVSPQKLIHDHQILQNTRQNIHFLRTIKFLDLLYTYFGPDIAKLKTMSTNFIGNATIYYKINIREQSALELQIY